MNQIFARILAYLFGAPATSASADVAEILATFTNMADRLAVASDKAVAEINDSYLREDDAYEAYVAVQDAERATREAARDAQDKAERAAQNIRALVEG